MSTIGADDLIFYTDKEGEIYSGGFHVNSILMKQGLSPMMTLNQDYQKGGKDVSDLFDHLVVPNWSLAFPFKQGGGIKKNLSDDNEDEDEVVSEDLHNQLLKMMSVDSSEVKQGGKQKTKKSQIKVNKKTKKNRKNEK